MKKISISLVLFIIIFSVSAQYYHTGGGFAKSGRVIVVEGDVLNVKEIKSLNVVFDYSNMAVGEYPKEELYVNKKVNEYNKKDKGRGDEWKNKWINAREEMYEPKFLELFNKTAKELGIEASKNNSIALYTLTVKTKFTEPGYNIGISRMNANIDLEYIFTNSEGKIIFQSFQGNIQGQQAMGFDYDVGTRISEAYAKGGKSLIHFIDGAIKKHDKQQNKKNKKK